MLLNMFQVKSKKVEHGAEIQSRSIIAKNAKIVKFHDFSSTLLTTNSESTASIQVSLHMHVGIIAINVSPKGELDWVNGAYIMRVQTSK